MRKIFFLIIIGISTNSANAKRPFTHIGIAVNNYVTAKPITGIGQLFTTIWHPGVTLQTGLNWKDKTNFSLNQTFKLTYFNHRFIQHGVGMYSEFGIRYKKVKNFGFTAALGGGYLHTINHTAQLKQKDDGTWERKFRSRPQALISLSLGVDYKINKKGHKIFVRYQNLLQTPFVASYVPLLPYNVFHLGYAVPFNTIFKKSEAK